MLFQKINSSFDLIFLTGNILGKRNTTLMYKGYMLSLAEFIFKQLYRSMYTSLRYANLGLGKKNHLKKETVVRL